MVDLHVPTQPLTLYSRQSLFTCTYISKQAIEIEPTKFSPQGIQAICAQQKDLIDKLLFKPKKGTLRQMDENIVELINQKISRDKIDPFEEEEVPISKSSGWKVD